jgi:predicted nuclease with TOPRIM domain
MTEKQLLDLKKDVEEAKTKVSELTGQQTALVNQLKTDWACKTIAEAEKKLKEMETEIDFISKKIENSVQELEEKYNV